MKLVVALVAILASAGSSVGDRAQSEVPNGACGVIQALFSVYSLGTFCLDTTSTDYARVIQYKTVEEQKEFFKNYCQRQPQIRGCLANVALKSQSCQNETRHQHFLTFRDLLETTLDAGCAGDGEVLANMVMIYKNDSTIGSNLKYFHQCLATYANKMYTSLAFDFSDFSRNYVIYRDVINARACFEHIEDGDPRIKTQIISLLNAIIEKYSCLQPQDNSVVRCNSLKLNGTGTHRVCPIKNMEGDATPLYNIILEQIPICFNVVDKLETQRMDTLNIEDTRTIVKNHCQKVPIISNNLQEVKHLSWLCMDQPHDLMIETVLRFLTNALDHLCAEDGRHLADVVFKVNSDVANKPSDTDAIRECFDAASPPGLDGDLTSEKSLEYYQTWKVFKECLIKKLKDDDVAASSAELLLFGVLKQIKCLNSDLTALVLCETIANTV